MDDDPSLRRTATVKIEQPGFYQTRHGRIAEVVGRVTGSPQTYPWVGVRSAKTGDAWACSWRDDGTFSADPSKEDGRDLVAYLGKTLRRLPDSEGWWWYEPSVGGRLVLRIWLTPVEEMPGRWGDKIEPSGFEEDDHA